MSEETLRPPQAPPTDPTLPPLVTHALFGAPQSGKTTLLAALETAATNNGRSFTPEPGPSTDFFTKLRTAMAPPKRFLPDRTELPDTLHITFGPRRAARPRPVDLAFRLRIMDVAGRVTRDEEAGEAPSAEREAFIEFLAACDGILFLVDPRRESEREQRDTNRHFRSALTRLAQRTGLHGMPRHVALCVTMLDHDPLLRRAAEAGFVTQDPHPPHLPRVRDRHARDFFEWLSHWPEQGGAREMHEALLAAFGEDAISYFVCSSVGFRLHDGRAVAMDRGRENWQNISPSGDRHKLLGPMNPVNVLEPVETLVARVLEERDHA
ncbi:TRAFAC clade GTPase domain-containing protein [Actinophytocola oryzae]|uniref:Double-GTPase 2 domain-containing protein n=1 Tax=Actinophytocola oryzae TaxID=502181 RepID=A0A4R7UZK0_9PSEU|nr:hypothetical protein [Actinophytocola oryzae]TDV40975.1 hypothetical protein CLV71_12141 [Actinophytocola oryzae]